MVRCTSIELFSVSGLTVELLSFSGLTVRPLSFSRWSDGLLFSCGLTVHFFLFPGLNGSLLFFLTAWSFSVLLSLFGLTVELLSSFGLYPLTVTLYFIFGVFSVDKDMPSSESFSVSGI